MVQFWWRSGSRFGSGSPKSEIQILRIAVFGGGLCSLSTSSYCLFLSDYDSVSSDLRLSGRELKPRRPPCCRVTHLSASGPKVTLSPSGCNWTMICCECHCRLFGFVARKSGSVTDNACHLFAELDASQPATAIVSFIEKLLVKQGQVLK